MSPEAARFIETTKAKGVDLRWNDRFDWRVALHQVKPDDWQEVIDALTGIEVRPLLRLAFVHEWAITPVRHVPQPVKVALCRIFMPPYAGPPVTLYHGCLAGEEAGMSWTGQLGTARAFARYKAARGETIVVSTITSDIVCHVRQFMKRCGEDEYVIDPARIGEVQRLETLPQRYDQKRKPLAASSGHSVHKAFRASFYREMARLRDAERTAAGM